MKFAKPLLLLSLLIATGLAAADEPSLPYTVQKSDKLIRLSRDLLVTPGAWGEVAKFNKMKDPNFITPGQVLQIPLRLLKYRVAAGRVVSTQGSVQMGGAPAVAGAPLPEGARFQVGANSSAVLELGDGTRVKLLPGTLAEVVSNRDYAMRDASVSGSNTWFAGLVRLAQGTVEALAAKAQRRATPLQIETPTSLVGVRGTEFRVAYEDPASRNARTEVTEGLVRADNTTQQIGAELPRGTGAVINPAQREVQVVKLLPAPDLSALPAEVQKPAGALALPPLAALAGAQAWRVQVASDDRFEKIVRDLKVASASVELGSLDVGKWFVRVRGIDAAGLEGFDAARPLAVAMAQRVVRLVNASMRITDGRTEMAVAFDPPLSPAVQATGLLWRDRALTQPAAPPTVLTPPAIAAAPAATADSRWDLGALPAGTYYVQFRLAPAGGTPAVTTEARLLEISPNWGVTVFDSTYPLQPLR